MAGTAKTTPPAKEKDRRKSSTGKSSIVTLKVSPDRLRKIIDPASVKEETPVKESPAPSSNTPAPEAVAVAVTAPADVTATAATNGDNASSSNPGTPAPAGTPSQTPMGPPTEGAKKKGTKRSAPGANGEKEPRARGKPGPKKKPRLEDGTIDPNAKNGGGAYHKLGPKANMGAINAGLRALDRSGKPCKKWAKGGFRLKTFTGVVWEIPRWTTPKPSVEEAQEVQTDSAEGSNKENKEGSQMKSENSASAADGGEQRSQPPSLPAASSPAPVPVAAAS